ncbi:MAG: hypothetical protein JW959_06960 [Pirellulales bacterium]|nr:hypothetical protein [Pirellulales bacterium]
MSLDETENTLPLRRVRICRPAFQDMCHLVMPRLAARAQLRRHAMKLRFWSRGDACVADLDCYQIPNQELFVGTVTDGFGLADGFHVVFCEEACPEPGGTICILSVMRVDEPFSEAAIEILRGREVIARERLRGWIVTRAT